MLTIDAVVLFFILGFSFKLLKVPFQFPEGLSKSLMLILLLAIGLKGGIALKENISWAILWQGSVVIALGIIIPFIAFPLLRYFGDFNVKNAANIAAHYGSVSVGTFAVAIAFLDSQGIGYEAYFPLFVVLLEVPAIIVGIMLVQWLETKTEVDKRSVSSRGQLAHEVFLNPGVALLVGGLLIGALSNDSINAILPLFKGLFSGVLALFLFEMGIIAASHATTLRHNSLFLIAFGMFMPLISSILGGLAGYYLLEFSAGGVMLLAVLAASASYIAVPAAMRVAIPDANHGVSIAASLAVTFPFNVLIGLPLYLAFAQWLSATPI